MPGIYRPRHPQRTVLYRVLFHSLPSAACFAAVYLGLLMKLRMLAGHVLRASNRVFGIPYFRLYALADEIRQFLYNFLGQVLAL